MLRKSVVLGLLLSLLLTVHALPTPILDIVNEVSRSSYHDYLYNDLFTHNGNNRAWSGADHSSCRDAILNTFNSFGLTSYVDVGTYSGKTYNNVVGTLIGTRDPGKIYIVGSHYDLSLIHI